MGLAGCGMCAACPAGKAALRRQRGSGVSERKERAMSDRPTAEAAGKIDVGGDLTVNRLGFGAMRITGQGVWGPPPDRGDRNASRAGKRNRRLL